MPSEVAKQTSCAGEDDKAYVIKGRFYPAQTPDTLLDESKDTTELKIDIPPSNPCEYLNIIHQLFQHASQCPFSEQRHRHCWRSLYSSHQLRSQSQASYD